MASSASPSTPPSAASTACCASTCRRKRPRAPISTRSAASGLDPIFLLAPTSTKERIRRVAHAGSGFVYYVSRAGVTGARASVRQDLKREVRALRRKLALPIAVGFGVSTPEQVREVAKVADGVVVGSALVTAAGGCRSRKAFVEKARELAAATR